MGYSAKKELVRIENGRFNNENGVLLQNLYLYLLKGQKTAIVYDNSFSVDAISDILSGEQTLSEGHICVNGELSHYAKAKNVLKRITAIISKRNLLSPQLHVWEAYHLVVSPRRFVLQNPNLYVLKLIETLSPFDVPFNFFARVGHLSPLERCLAELMLAYIQKKDIIILSNLRDFLSDSECKIFMRYVDKMADMGFTFLLFDNDKDFLKRNAVSTFVIRHGRTIGQFDQDTYHKYPGFNQPTFTGPVSSDNTHQADSSSNTLAFDNVYYQDLENISFSISSGEIAAIKCSNHKEYMLLRSLLFGDGSPEKGRVILKNQIFQANGLQHAIDNGMCMIEEDATNTMLNEKEDMLANCYLNIVNRIDSFVLQDKYRISMILRLLKYFSPEDFKFPIQSLSTIEKERLIFCKMLLYSPAVLVCMHPFSFPDINTIETVKSMLKDCSENNISILMLAYNLPDLTGLNVTEYHLQNGKLNRR